MNLYLLAIRFQDAQWEVWQREDVNLRQGNVCLVCVLGSKGEKKWVLEVVRRMCSDLNGGAPRFDVRIEGHLIPSAPRRRVQPPLSWFGSEGTKENLEAPVHTGVALTKKDTILLAEPRRERPVNWPDQRN